VMLKALLQKVPDIWGCPTLLFGWGLPEDPGPRVAEVVFRYEGSWFSLPPDQGLSGALRATGITEIMRQASIKSPPPANWLDKIEEALALEEGQGDRLRRRGREPAAGAGIVGHMIEAFGEIVVGLTVLGLIVWVTLTPRRIRAARHEISDHWHVEVVSTQEKFEQEKFEYCDYGEWRRKDTAGVRVEMVKGRKRVLSALIEADDPKFEDKLAREAEKARMKAAAMQAEGVL
jgi:hypothetical protein